MPEICLFPIPDCVTFPGTKFPLHVFEPRYRMMIKHCLDNNMLLGVCHTKDIIYEAPDQSREQALQSNQSTYEPYEIFSAGYCELQDTTDDGRMYLTVHLEQRYKAIKQVQTIPYLVYECEALLDQDESEPNLLELEALKQQLLKELVQRIQISPELLEKFQQEDWQSKSIEAFSFEIFTLINFGAEQQQKILSMTSKQERLQTAIDLMRNSSIAK